MGYETELIFVTGQNKTKAGRICGYQSVEATLEMGKCANGAFGELIDKCRVELQAVHEKLSQEVEKVERDGKELYTHEGYYTEALKTLNVAQRTKRSAPHWKAKKALEAKLPYFYKDGNTELFLDQYGDLLLVASLKDVKQAVIKSNAEEVANGNYERGYRRFNIALRMIEAFELDFGEDVQVILYGH